MRWAIRRTGHQRRPARATDNKFNRLRINPYNDNGAARSFFQQQQTTRNVTLGSLGQIKPRQAWPKSPLTAENPPPRPHPPAAPQPGDQQDHAPVGYLEGTPPQQKKTLFSGGVDAGFMAVTSIWGGGGGGDDNIPKQSNEQGFLNPRRSSPDYGMTGGRDRYTPIPIH